MPRIGPMELLILIVVIMIPVALIWGLIHLFRKLDKKPVRNQPLNTEELNRGVQYCTRCGQKLEAETEFCPVCGTKKLCTPEKQ
ncbi:hypothetical protein DA01_02615 [Dehalococcoides mccartyi]|uniref:Zinc-ribbon domain-containing protein n=1 Tax=Dehalococcoides mccartyi TaxID=61435 RepID=A0A0V8M3P8_9CHLR|nr:zinc ribbon domain-containing protein [Dehalococcoides mccartyi]KSV18336.1 hypothetical protein DA01_02615 [Dehalococcoides mccartyi]